MTSKKIHLLPEHLIDQIKAGEVIERPASIIKELIENSIDANSTKIDIHIVDNGLELISIVDNGDGMEFDDLPYAFCRHATSKIERFEDIYSLYSYGFRGEALASMSSIARITCTSVPKSNPENGGKIVIHGGETLSHSEYQSRKLGTGFFIKDLFYNTPARLKFVKSKTSEKNSLKRILYSFILSHPEITFTLKWDDKEKEFYRRVEDGDFSKRVKQIVFKKGLKDSDKELYLVSGEYEENKVYGYVSQYTSKGSAGKGHYLFINGRLFTDRQIHQTIIRNMEKLWPSGETGHYCIMINVPPSQVDVNVHPNKTQVKFFKSAEVFSLVSACIKKTITEVKNASPSNLMSSLANEQKDLFSESQTRDFSFSDFTDTPFEAAGNLFNPSADTYEPSVSHQAQALLQETSNSINFGANYTLFKDEQNQAWYLANHSKYLGLYILRNIEKQPECSEMNITPLLISEPFQVESHLFDEHFPFLKSLGFEFDRLDDEIIALRSIPSYLNEFPTRDIVLPLIEFLKIRNSVSLESLYSFLRKDYQVSINHEFSQEIELIQSRLSLSFLLESKAVVKCSNENLDRLFE